MTQRNTSLIDTHKNESSLYIGDIPVTLSTEYGAVKVLFDLHRNGHQVPANDPRLAKVNRYVAALKEAVPGELLNNPFEDKHGAPLIHKHSGSVEVIFLTTYRTTDPQGVEMSLVHREENGTQRRVFNIAQGVLSQLQKAEPDHSFAARLEQQEAPLLTVLTAAFERAKATPVTQEMWVKDTVEAIRNLGRGR